MEKLTISENEAGRRLDQALALLLDNVSREKIKHAIASGAVSIIRNGQAIASVKPSSKLRVGDIVEIERGYILDEPTQLSPEPFTFPVIYEDDYIFAIDKPAGVVVHPGAGVTSGTVANAIISKIQKEGWLDQQRPGIIHRLDKDTSGIMLIAKDADALAQFSKMFAERRIKKVYIAVVKGRLEFDEGIIDAPIERDNVKREYYRVGYGADAKEAITEYRTVERGDKASIVELSPKTGRTHQLRVHLRHIGHPIIGDKKYGHNEPAYPRLCLHAFGLEFVHPYRKGKVSITTPTPDFVSDFEENSLK